VKLSYFYDPELKGTYRGHEFTVRFWRKASTPSQPAAWLLEIYPKGRDAGVKMRAVAESPEKTVRVLIRRVDARIAKISAAHRQRIAA
jgi:hypothetical protein